nr:YscO family type III secretion system apparatus protein [Pleionea sp. CnH1-48]
MKQIKNLREKNAHDAYRRAESHWEEAVGRYRQKEQELEEYKAYRKKETQEQYDKIQDQLVSRKDLEDLRAYLSGLQKKELSIIEHVSELKKAADDAEQAKNHAKVEHKEALKQVEKFTELAAANARVSIRQAQLTEDAALDDFIAKSPTGV